VREALFQELIDRDPSVGISIKRYNKTESVAVGMDALRLVLARSLYASPVCHLAVMAAALTGLRAGEVRALLWDDLDLKERTLRVARTMRGYSSEIGPPKSGRTRVVSIPLKLKALLDPLSKSAGGYVFSATRKAALSYRYLASSLSKAAAEAGSPGLTLHGLRHSLNTNLRGAGVSDELLRAWFGWSGTGIQENYTHRALYDLRPVADAIDNLFKEV
jgi:integrase